MSPYSVIIVSSLITILTDQWKRAFDLLTCLLSSVDPKPIHVMSSKTLHDTILHLTIHDNIFMTFFKIYSPISIKILYLSDPLINLRMDSFSLHPTLHRSWVSNFLWFLCLIALGFGLNNILKYFFYS